jgi:hypothetical protein
MLPRNKFLHFLAVGCRGCARASRYGPQCMQIVPIAHVAESFHEPTNPSLPRLAVPAGAAMKTPLPARRVLGTLLAVALLLSLGGCYVLVPGPGYYGYHGGWHHRGDDDR